MISLRCSSILAAASSVELCELGDVVPHFFVVGMENMRAVLVDVDALDVLGVDVARDVGALIHDEHGLAVGLGLMCKNGAVQTGTDNQIIIYHIYSLTFPPHYMV